MGVARIVGHTVRAAARDSHIGKIYVISGEGASGLHHYCKQIDLPVSPLIENSFHISAKTIDNECAQPDLNRLYICNGIVEAANEKGRAL